MKNKLDLNTYLTRYGQQATDTPFNAAQSRSKKFQESSYDRGNFQEPEPYQSQQVHFTGFSKSQNQCIEQLQQIKRSLNNEERQLSYFLQNYSKKLYDNLLIEHNRIREQLLDMFDRAFSDSEKRLSEIVARENGNEPLEFVSIRKRIQQINHKIEKLDQMLRGDSYRNAIAEVVTSNFEQEMKNIDALIGTAQKNVLDNGVKLVMDQNAFNRLKDDIQNLVTTDGNKRMSAQHGLGSQGPPISLGNSGVRKSSKQRLGLFDTAPQQMRENVHNSGGFFNFNNN